MPRPIARATLVLLLAVALTRCSGCEEDEDCPSGLTNCGGACVDLATDGQNCGACFVACPAVATCAGGACLCPNPGEVVCNGACVDPATYATDPANCGGCGIACGFGTCAGGTCQCEGGTLCEGQSPRCADLQGDPANCGTCGHVCESEKPGSGCAGGVCACLAPKDDDCLTFCTDTLTDRANCGADAATGCGNACPLANEECAGGSCACPVALPAACPTVNPTACVDLQTDRANCGTCGNACPKANEICSAGACECPPALPDTCGSACVSKATDPLNCGGCDVHCVPGATCANGQCSCGPGEAACPSGCENLGTDERNCGECARACPAGATCTAGTCVCPAAQPQRCGSTCCAGNECCAGGTSCPLVHANGLGGTYLDCGALDQHTADQARRAAASWGEGTTVEVGLCSVNCLCRQTATQAAVWCYVGSNAKGRVLVTNTPNCFVALCPTQGNGLAWH